MMRVIAGLILFALVHTYSATRAYLQPPVVWVNVCMTDVWSGC